MQFFLVLLRNRKKGKLRVRDDDDDDDIGLGIPDLDPIPTPQPRTNVFKKLVSKKMNGVFYFHSFRSQKSISSHT